LVLPWAGVWAEGLMQAAGAAKFCICRTLGAVAAAVLFGLSATDGFATDLLAANAPDLSLVNAPRPEKPSRDYNSMALGPWLFSPSLFVGGIYDSNINQTSINKISGYGERVVPSFTAFLNNGIHRTNIYGLLDARFYQVSGATDQTQVAAKTGFNQTYEAQRDLVFTFSGDYTRQQDVFGSWAFAQNTPIAGGPTSVLSAPTTISPQTSPSFYNQFTGAASVQKTFMRAFVAAGFSTQYTKFDHNPGTNRDGTIYTLPVRVGYFVTPQAYLFSDSSVDWRQYADSTQNSNGYRLTGGIGSNQGLWAAEVYAGYQAEKNDVVGTFGSPILGARLTYSPTRLWVVRLQVDESLSSATITGSPGSLVGTANRVTDALLYVTYNGLPLGWTGNARFGYVRTAAVDTTRVDNGWLVGLNISYAIWRNLSAMLDYQFTQLASNVSNQSFNKHVVSVGMSYKY